MQIAGSEAPEAAALEYRERAAAHSRTYRERHTPSHVRGNKLPSYTPPEMLAAAEAENTAADLVIDRLIGEILSLPKRQQIRFIERLNHALRRSK
jgi:hypothetical protein